MSQTRKMVLVPADKIPISKPSSATQAPYVADISDEFTNQAASPIVTEKKKSDKVFDRTKKLFNVALKLALVNGYDFDLKLVDINGAVVPHSNIELLINHALSHGKLLVGEEQFVQLLHKANVDPEMIVNENIKEKLRLYRNNNMQKSIKPVEMIVRSKLKPKMDAENYATISRVP
jgi:hypothetical protein